MRIAQVAPLFESVPPKAYGGTERIVHYLTEELVRQGHDVTLFASADSKTSARLIPCIDRALRLGNTYRDPYALHVLMLEHLLDRLDEFDVVHFHTDYLHYPLVRRIAFPHITTLHGRQDNPELPRLYREYTEVPLVSISNHQRLPIYWANWQGTVYHGLPLNLYKEQLHPEDYLAFLGRVSPEKGLDRAIEIAKQSGMRLKVAAKVDPADREYYESHIRPLLSQDHVEYIGEISENEKNAFLGQARALLFPIDWPEPFGLVMIEAMACGTPVIAFSSGSVPEVIDHGLSGYIVHSIDDAIAAVKKLDRLSRSICRRTFERRFTVSNMATHYMKIFRNRVDDCKGQFRFKSGPHTRGVEHPWRRPI